MQDIGRTLGKYELIEQIGVGGFGEVYRGRDPYIKRPVAVKTCSSSNEEIRSRFFQEAEIAGNLHHRNITTVYDFGVQDEMPYLVQEYLSGEDLDRKIKRRDYLPWPEKLLYLLQTARGLAYAHERGVIHRDIKPANVRILEDGTTKIMDFGIAKLAQQETGLTQTGMTLGTAAYLSPEQIRGGMIDVRTDIFSFGVLAYELLTYERPFQGDQISQVLYKLIHEPPPPMTDHWPAAPRGIVDLVERCLQKEPTNRPRDGEALVRELEGLQRQLRQQWSSGQSVIRDPAPTPPPSAPVARPASASGPPRDPASGGLDELELTAHGTQPVRAVNVTAAVPTVGDAATPHVAARARDGARWRPLLAVLALALVAGGAGWFFGTRGGASGAGAGGAPDEATVAASAIDVESPERGVATEPTPDAPTPGTPDDSPDDGASSEPTDAASSRAAGAAEPAVDTPPAASRIVVSRMAWARSPTVELAGRTYSLDRTRDIEVDPGSHRLTFRVDDEGYRLERERRVQVGVGETVRVDPPIQAPARLSVRPFPRRPQGVVSIDGAEGVDSPVRRLPLEPGRHIVEVRPRGEGEPLRRVVELRSSRETILTFDLESGTLEEAVKEPGR